MIVLKTSRELAAMRKAGKISQQALRLAGEAVEPGVSTWELDKIIRQFIEKSGATPSFLNYGGFPASACISVNDVVIHGIPGKSTILKKGDIVGIDVGACYEGFHGDNAWTFPVGEISPEAQALLDATEKALFLGIAQARPRQPAGGHRARGAGVCRSSQLLGGTRIRRPRSRCEAARRSQRSQLRHARQGRETVARHDHRHRAHGEPGESPGAHFGRWLDHSDPGTEAFPPTSSTPWPSQRTGRSF